MHRAAAPGFGLALASALTLALLLTGCGVEEPAAPGEAALVPSEWELAEGVPMVDGYPITLRLEDGRVTGTAACNTYSGDVDLGAERFSVGDLARTEMGCPEPGVHDSESAYLDALQAVERQQRVDGQLLLLGPGVELRFDPVSPEEDAALTGTDWRLASLLSGSGPEGTASSTMAEAALQLSDDGTFTASDGCNALDGRWSLDGDVLLLADVVTTDAACPDLEQQVDQVHRVLLGEPALVLRGRRLVLWAGDEALEYRAG